MSNADGFQLACRLDKSALPRTGDAHHCNENVRHAAETMTMTCRDLSGSDFSMSTGLQVKWRQRGVTN